MTKSFRIEVPSFFIHLFILNLILILFEFNLIFLFDFCFHLIYYLLKNSFFELNSIVFFIMFFVFFYLCLLLFALAVRKFFINMLTNSSVVFWKALEKRGNRKAGDLITIFRWFSLVCAIRRGCRKVETTDSLLSPLIVFTPLLKGGDNNEESW